MQAASSDIRVLQDFVHSYEGLEPILHVAVAQPPTPLSMEVAKEPVPFRLSMPSEVVFPFKARVRCAQGLLFSILIPTFQRGPE